MKVEDITPGPLGHHAYRIVFLKDDELDQAALEQFKVLMAALAVYRERNVEYRDNWKRMGWRGQLVRVRERAERLWDSLWGHSPEEDGGEWNKKLDDALDLINFAGFLCRAVADGNRDGSWWGEI